MLRVEQKLLLDVGAGQRLIGAAAEMRLTFLDHSAIVEDGADVPREGTWIRIIRIDLVADLSRQRQHVRIPHSFIGERVKTDATAHKTGRDNERRGELGGIAIGRSLLGCEWFPEAVHGALAHVAHHFLQVLGLDALGGQTAGAVDVWVGHGPAGVRLEGERLGHPAVRMQLDTGALTINNEDPFAMLMNYARFVGHIHASEPELVPLGDGGTDHGSIGNAVQQHLPNHVVSIEMLATKTEPHEASIERALKVAIRYYRNNGVELGR